MEPGEQSSNNGRKDKRKSSVSNAEDIAAQTRKTLDKIKRMYHRDRIQTDTQCYFHDSRCPGYGWLLPGWVAEERHTKSDRVYRFYYDPQGYFYPTKRKVIEALKRRGIIVLDK